MTLRENGDADLKRAFSSFSGEPPIGNCPDPEEIWVAVRGEGTPEATRAIVLHTAACASCAEAWRVARGATADMPAAFVPAPAWRSAWVWAPALAAAALLVIGVLTNGLLPLPRPSSSPQLRDAAAPVVSALIPDNAELDRNGFVLRWTPGPPGARYNVRVTTEDLTVVAERWGIDAPQYQVGASALASLPAGTRLLWQVDVVSPDQALRTSPTFTVRVR